MSLGLHVHEQPLLASQLFASAELIERRESKADPTEIFRYVIAGGLVDLAVDAEDKAVAGKVVHLTEFEEGHQTKHS